MVDAAAHHKAGLKFLQSNEFRIGHLFGGIAPSEAFLPDQQAGFIAEVEEAAVLRVVAAAHEVAIHPAQVLQVFKHQLRRDGRAEFRVKFMPVHSFQEQRFPIQQQTVAVR